MRRCARVGGLNDESRTMREGGLVLGGIGVGRASWGAASRGGRGRVQTTWKVASERWNDAMLRAKKSTSGRSGAPDARDGTRIDCLGACGRQSGVG